MVIRTKAPLRLGLAGGGTDVSPYSEEFGGCVLNATIDMYAYCTIEVTKENKLSFYASDRKEYFETELIQSLKIDNLLPLHKGVYNRIITDFNHGEPFSFKMTTYCDVPAGSGLGSSSTMVVAMLKAFAKLLNVPLAEYDLAYLAYKIERIDVGLNGGKQDQYAAAFGGFNFIEFYENDKVIVNSLSVKKSIINELEASMILYYTGVSRESGKIIEEQCNSKQTKNEKSLEALHQLKVNALIMKEAILQGDILKFAQYLGKSWSAKKKTTSSISNEYLDAIYAAAIEAGAYAGKVSGAGGGGFMMFIVDPIRKLDVIRGLNKFEGQVVNFHFTTEGT